MTRKRNRCQRPPRKFIARIVANHEVTETAAKNQKTENLQDPYLYWIDRNRELEFKKVIREK